MTHIDLFKEFETMSREMDRILGNVGFGRIFEPVFPTSLTRHSYPQISLGEDENHVFVEALVPGIDPKDLEMTLLGNTLTLSAERTTDPAGKVTWHRRERGAGKFLRTVELPGKLDPDGVKADFRDGVLTVTIPKALSVRPRKIAITAS